MYIAEKGHRQYRIQERDIEMFVKEGYDIFTEEGNRIRKGARERKLTDEEIKNELSKIEMIIRKLHKQYE